MKKLITAMLMVPLLSCKDGKEKIEYSVNGTDSVRSVYSSNGFIREKGDYHDNNYNGLYVKYHEGIDVIGEKGVMVDGKKNGVWKTFDKGGALLTVSHYYRDTLIFNLDKNDFVFKEVEAPFFKVKCPSSWDVKVNEGPVLLQAEKSNCKQQFCPNITVTRDTLPEKLDDFIEKNLSQLSQQVEGYGLISKNQVEIDKKASVQCCYAFQYNNINLVGLTTWVLDGKTVYIITAVASNIQRGEFLKYRGVFEEMMFSFSVKQ